MSGGIERVLTSAEFAEMERCKPQTISDACRAGEVPGAYRASQKRGSGGSRSRR